MTDAVQAIKKHVAIGNIVVVGALTHYALLHSVCDIKKIAKMNVHCSLISELLCFKSSKGGHNTADKTKNICYTKK